MDEQIRNRSEDACSENGLLPHMCNARARMPPALPQRTQPAGIDARIFEFLKFYNFYQHSNHKFSFKIYQCVHMIILDINDFMAHFIQCT